MQILQKLSAFSHQGVTMERGNLLISVNLLLHVSVFFMIICVVDSNYFIRGVYVSFEAFQEEEVHGRVSEIGCLTSHATIFQSYM